MLNITFGEVDIDKTNSTIERLVFSSDLVNGKTYKTIFLVIKNTNIIVGSMGDVETLFVEDPTNNVVIFNNTMKLHNMEIRTENNEILYNYSFIEVLQ